MTENHDQNEKVNEVLDPEIEKYISKKQKFIKEVKSIFIIILGVLVFRSVLFEPFRIPSGSMIPTLMIGDFILVNKFAYGFKVPFSDLSTARFNWDPIYLFGEKEPQRGDVIVFKYPQEPNINYIKRVVAVGGDRIEIRNKQLFVNGEPIAQEQVSGEEIMEDMDEKFQGFNLEFYEAVVGDTKHIIQFDSDSFYKTDLEARTVPEGHYFTMGDNRDFSYDSRFWGFVPHEMVKGRAMFVWFSMSLPFGENTFKFRPWRIGTPIR